ncbi:16693_t:CDS:2, partial [Racocetra fulgida]
DKDLAKKPRPWRINLLLELARNNVKYQTMIDLFDNLVPATLDVYAILFCSGQFSEYVEAVFRIWTFAL